MARPAGPARCARAASAAVAQVGHEVQVFLGTASSAIINGLADSARLSALEQRRRHAAVAANSSSRCDICRSRSRTISASSVLIGLAVLARFLISVPVAGWRSQVTRFGCCRALLHWRACGDGAPSSCGRGRGGGVPPSYLLADFRAARGADLFNLGPPGDGLRSAAPAVLPFAGGVSCRLRHAVTHGRSGVDRQPLLLPSAQAHLVCGWGRPRLQGCSNDPEIVDRPLMRALAGVKLLVEWRFGSMVLRCAGRSASLAAGLIERGQH